MSGVTIYTVYPSFSAYLAIEPITSSASYPFTISTGKTIVWDVNLTEANGIERYPFGPDGNISLKAAARRSATEKPRIEVDSNIPFKLVVRYGDKEETFQVQAGKNNF